MEIYSFISCIFPALEFLDFLAIGELVSYQQFLKTKTGLQTGFLLYRRI